MTLVCTIVMPSNISFVSVIIQFTKICIERGLPIDIIKLILLKNNPDITSCDMCKNFAINMITRTCNCCTNSTNRCLPVCHILMRSCYTCKAWYCDACCENKKEGRQIFKCDCGRGIVY